MILKIYFVSDFLFVDPPSEADNTRVRADSLGPQLRVGKAK
jgi:hypothetical protein